MIRLNSKDIGPLIKSIDEKLKAKADVDMKTYNLTLVQSFVLTFLQSRGGSASQKEIENYLDISHPAVVGIVSRMEQNGHVITWMDPNDKRIKMVQLTEKADALGMEMNKVRGQMEEDLLAGFSEEEKKKLRELLTRVEGNLIKLQSR
ncbi:MAG: MarR family winged helix-turn-helix transcriptional regulator [Bariatricus sp.]